MAVTIALKYTYDISGAPHFQYTIPLINSSEQHYDVIGAFGCESRCQRSWLFEGAHEVRGAEGTKEATTSRCGFRSGSIMLVVTLNMHQGHHLYYVYTNKLANS